MRRIFLIAAVCTAHLATGQTTKTFTLYAVAEGNFGTPNGDVFKVSNGNGSAVTVSAPLYQTANSTTAGFDVLQDFEVTGNKAVFTSKSSSSKIAIANFPAFDSVKTFPITGGQCLGKASPTKVYVSYASGNTIKLIDLVSNTLTTVSDPAGSISSYATYMVPANGFLYAAIGSKIVKIDTATNAVTGTVLPNLGAIAGLQFDTAGKAMWILGKSGGTSTLVKMEVQNNDLLATPVVLTGVTNASQLRLAGSKLYFLSGKSVHIYNTASPSLPTTAVYTSTLGGSASGFAYGKAFTVDPVSGDFAIGHANGYANASLYEVIDGTTFTSIATGTVTGSKIVNELMLSTAPVIVPTLATLPTIQAQCSATLIAPTATAGSTLLTGTTTAPLTYAKPGTYAVTWTYTINQSTLTQTQSVVIADTIAPVPTLVTLPTLAGTCPYTVTSIPTATDNCLGLLTATTGSPLTYSTGGTFTIQWTYSDSSANVTTQSQTVVVDCSTSAVSGQQASTFSVQLYPNPVRGALHVRLEKAAAWTVALRDLTGREVLFADGYSTESVISVAHLPAGIYAATFRDAQSGTAVTRKVLLQP